MSKVTVGRVKIGGNPSSQAHLRFATLHSMTEKSNLTLTWKALRLGKEAGRNVFHEHCGGRGHPMDMLDNLLAIEASILFARKIAQRYVDQNMTDDPNYLEIVRLIAELERKYEALLDLGGVLENA